MQYPSASPFDVESGKYDEIFEDYASGGSTNRPKLQEMLKWIRKGDVVEVHSIDRLARNNNGKNNSKWL